MKKNIKSTIISYKKQKSQQKNMKLYELNKRRTLIRKQNESNKEMKQNERKQKRENILDEGIDLGRFFELATTNRKYVNGLNLHEIRNVFLENYTGDFELIGSMLIVEIEQKEQKGWKMSMISKLIIML